MEKDEQFAQALDEIASAASSLAVGVRAIDKRGAETSEDDTEGSTRVSYASIKLARALKLFARALQELGEGNNAGAVSAARYVRVCVIEALAT